MTFFIPPLWSAFVSAWVDPDPEDDPDLFQCIHCERFKSIDERNDYGPDGPGSFCEACGVGM